MQLDLHPKYDEAISICLFLGKVLGSEVGAGILRGRETQCRAEGIYTDMGLPCLPCPHLDLSFTKHLTPL